MHSYDQDSVKPDGGNTGLIREERENTPKELQDRANMYSQELGVDPGGAGSREEE